MNNQFRFTKISAQEAVGKGFALEQDGRIHKSTSLQPYRGSVTTRTALFSLQGFNEILDSFSPNEILMYGEPTTHCGIEGKVTRYITSEERKKKNNRDAYARTLQLTSTAAGANYLLAFDFDPKSEEANVTVDQGIRYISECFGTPNFLYAVFDSTSTRLVAPDGTRPFPGGFRIFTLIDGSLYRNVKLHVEHYFLSKGLSSIILSSSGSTLLRHPFDVSVFDGNRIDYTLTPPRSHPDGYTVAQLRLLASNFDGVPVTLHQSQKDLVAERNALVSVLKAEFNGIHSVSIFNQVISELQQSPDYTNIKPEKLKRLAKKETKKRLSFVDGKEIKISLPHTKLQFTSPYLGSYEWTVGDLFLHLNSEVACKALVGRTLNDPDEPNYPSKGCAKILSASNRKIVINSFAHGGRRFCLVPEMVVETPTNIEDSGLHDILKKISKSIDSKDQNVFKKLVKSCFSLVQAHPMILRNIIDYSNPIWKKIFTFNTMYRCFPLNYFIRMKDLLDAQLVQIQKHYLLSQKNIESGDNCLDNFMYDAAGERLRLNPIHKKNFGVYGLYGALGSGKTSRVVKFIEEIRDFISVPIRIISVNPLHSLTLQSSELFNLITSQEMFTGDLDVGVSTCIHSLDKVLQNDLFNIPGEFNIIIFDEFPQIINNLTLPNDLISPERQMELLDTIKYLLNGNRKITSGSGYSSNIVFINSADFNDELINKLALEPYNAEIRWSTIESQHRFNPEIEMNLCKKVFDSIAISFINKKRSIIMCDTVKDVLYVEKQAKMLWPESKRLVIHNSKGAATTSLDDVKKFYEDPNKECKSFDIIIASPAIQSGISITVPWFVNHYQIVRGFTISPYDLNQQIARDRTATKIIIGILPFSAFNKNKSKVNNSLLKEEIDYLNLDAVFNRQKEMAMLYDYYAVLLDLRYKMVINLDFTLNIKKIDELNEMIFLEKREQILTNPIIDEKIFKVASMGIGQQDDINGVANYEACEVFNAVKIEDCIDFVGHQFKAMDKFKEFKGMVDFMGVQENDSFNVACSTVAGTNARNEFGIAMFGLFGYTDFNLNSIQPPVSTSEMELRLSDWNADPYNKILLERVQYLGFFRSFTLKIRTLQNFISQTYGIHFFNLRKKKQVFLSMTPRGSNSLGLIDPGMYMMLAYINGECGSYDKLNKFVDGIAVFTSNGKYPEVAVV